MFNKIITVLLCLTFIFMTNSYINFAYAQSAELTGRDIALKVHDRPDGDDRKGVMQMTLINRRGKTRE